MKRWSSSTLVLLLCSAGCPVAAQEPDPAVPTNLQVYQELAARLADSLALTLAQADSPAVRIHVAPADVRWFLEDPVSRAFQSRRCAVFVSDSVRYSAEFGALNMRVKYANIRRPGLFSSRVVDRTVLLSAQLRIADRATGIVLFSGEKSGERSDTVELSQIESLETSWVPATRGSLPPEGFFSGWVEPLIVIGSVAVAIYLLFTVRS